MTEMLSGLWFFLKFAVYKPWSVRFYLRHGQSSEHLNTIDRDRILGMLKYAQRLSPYYRSRLIHFKNVTSINQDDWHRIPILTRQDLVRSTEAIIIPEVKTTTGSTGGTTGQPLKYYQNRDYPIEAFRWIYHTKMGVKPWCNSAHFWRIPTKKTSIAKRLEAVLLWPTKRIKIDASSLTSEKKTDAVNQLIKNQIPLVQGYVGAIHELAQFILTNNLSITCVRAVWVTSAPLTSGVLNVISQAFNCPVWDEYGSSEIPYIGLRKANNEGAILINSGHRVVEVINPDKNGFGDIIITDLLNRAMPIIRYQNGDRAKFIDGHFQFARNISPVKGRVSENIFVTKEHTINGSYLTTIFDDFASDVSQFKIIQNHIGHITIYVQWSCRCQRRQEIMSRVSQAINELSLSTLKIDFESVHSIAHDRGKMKFIESNISP